MTDREAYIALNTVEGIGPITVRKLIDALGSVTAVFDADAALLRSVRGVGPESAKRLLGAVEQGYWRREIDEAEALGITILTPVDIRYPAALKEIHDPPLALYVQGELCDRDGHGVAMVGTRQPTHYGMEMARKFAFGLAKAGLTVVSGLARGIDTASHMGALTAKGRTIAVIGAGLKHIYPSENRELAAQIAENGAVISEFPLDRKPDKTTFPMRNRIVSGLTQATVVIEAGRKSGSIITATQAVAQGRTVFALPGRIDSYASQGTNALLKDGASVITGLDDILEHYEILRPVMAGAGPTGSVRSQVRPSLNQEENRLVDLITRGIGDVDRLIRESGLGPARVGALLVALELKRMIKLLPGRQIELVGS